MVKVKFEILLTEMLKSFLGKIREFRNLTISFHGSNESRWWNVKETCRGNLFDKILQHYPYHDCENFITIYIFNEKSFPSKLGNLAVKG